MVQQQGGGGPGGRGPINVGDVNVNRATVSRAEITRMSMDGNAQGAQETLLQDISSKLTGGQGSLRESLDKIHSAIEECCVGGGAQDTSAKKLKQAHEDAAGSAGELSESQQGLAKSLEDLQQTMRVLIMQQGSLSVSTGEATENVEKQGGAALAGQKAFEKQNEALQKVLFSFRKLDDGTGKMVIEFGDAQDRAKSLGEAMGNVWESLREARMAEYVKTLNLGIQSLQNFSSELVDLQSNFRKFMDTFMGDMKESRDGLTTTFSMLFDQLENLGGFLTGQGIRDTERMVLDAIREIGEAQGMLLMGRSLEEVGEFTKQTRDAILKGNDARLRTMFGVEGTNQMSIDTYKLLTRRGIQDDIARSMTEEVTRKRMTLIANVAQNTGLTYEAVKDLEKEEGEKLEDLMASGAITSKRQLEMLKKLQTSTAAQDPQVNELLTEFVKARGFLGNLSEETRNMLTVSNAQNEMLELLRLVNEGSAKDLPRIEQVMKDMGEKMTSSIVATSGQGQRILEETSGMQEDRFGRLARGLQGLVDASRDPENKPKGDSVVNAISHLQETIKQFIPTSILGLATAVFANVAALWANTAALMGTGNPLKWLKRGFKRGAPGGPGRGRFGDAARNRLAARGGRPLLSGPGAQAGRTVGTRAAATLGARALPVLGTAGAVAGAGLAGYGLGTFINENLTNKEGRRMSDWLSDRMSDWFGPDVSEMTKPVTIEDINKSRAERGLPPITPKTKTQTAGPKPPQVADAEKKTAQASSTQDEQKNLLQQIRDTLVLIERSNQVAADGITKIGVAGPGTTTNIQATAK